jgi:hypothetical protein
MKTQEIIIVFNQQVMMKVIHRIQTHQVVLIKDSNMLQLKVHTKNRRPTLSSRNDFNSSIMKLEEQVNRLSKLTKRIRHL